MVRPQPTQTFRASNAHTLMQGDATAGANGAGGKVMTDGADHGIMGIPPLFFKRFLPTGAVVRVLHRS